MIIQTKYFQSESSDKQLLIGRAPHKWLGFHNVMNLTPLSIPLHERS